MFIYRDVENMNKGTIMTYWPSPGVINNIYIGKNTIIQKGTVIGGDGFNYTREEDGTLTFNEHKYGVLIGDDVHIGSNCSIDNGRHRNTMIADGTKIDNLVHIAHNVHIGKHCLIGPCAVILGSVNINDYAEIWSNCTIHQWVTIGKGAVVGAGTYLRRDVPDYHVAYMKGDKLIIKPRKESKKYGK